MNPPLAAVTLQDWCSILTAGAAIITAIVVGWYTWITAKLQRTTQEQVSLAKQQLAQAISQAGERNEKEMRQARPRIKWTAINPNAEGWELVLKFENIGGPLYDLHVTAPETQFANVKNPAAIRTNEESYISLQNRNGLPSIIKFTISGITSYPEHVMIVYTYNGHGFPTLVKD